MTFDIDGIMLTSEEEAEFDDDIWEAGIPPMNDELHKELWEKWGKRMGIPKPKFLLT